MLPGTFGDVLEATLRADHDVTLGHWPQSIDLSTVGGWLACRSAGQMSTRYGKIEDMVVGLDVALADGRRISTGGYPRAAVGPDLDAAVRRQRGHARRDHRRPAARAPGTAPRAPVPRSASTTFADGLDACRRILRRGATPAVLRLYDATEADRSYKTGDIALLLVLDEGDSEIVDMTMDLVAEECIVDGTGRQMDEALVEQWMQHRNDVSALEALISRGFVVDTMEVAAPWGRLDKVYEEGVAAIKAVPGTVAASAHQSHSYPDGACLYFTFAGQVEPDDRDRYYTAAWDAGTRAALAHGAALSHHHGIGMNRARFVADALGPAFDVLVAAKNALDPNGILNPGKLGLPSPFGEVPWP